MSSTAADQNVHSHEDYNNTRLFEANHNFGENNGVQSDFAPVEHYQDLCHEKFDEYGYLMNDIGHFWLEGISLLIVGLFGVAGNIMTIIVLRKMETNTTFNRLLMSLGMFPNYVPLS